MASGIFFFQAEDGIRDYKVTGVQTCALPIFLIPLPFLGGIGTRTAIVALVLYALLPILRNTVVGLTNLDPAVLEAAEAMGMTETQILLKARFPLGLSVVLAGIRTATVITIGVATIAAAIGAGGQIGRAH